MTSILFKKFYLIYYFIQQVLISYPFYTYQYIHVNPNLPIHLTTTTTAPTPPPPPLSPIGVHTFVLYICVSISLFKMRIFEHRDRHAQRKDDVKTYRKKHVNRVIPSTYQRMPMIASKHQMLEEQRSILPLCLQREHGLADTQIPDF